MRIPSTIQALLVLLLSAAPTSTQATTTTTTTITLQIPVSPPHLPNPNTLAASTTHATLTQLGARHEAPLSTANTFVFRNVSAGSWLADVHSASHAFAPLRIDIVAPSETEDSAAGKPLKVRAWETFRGNDWENKGLEVVGAAAWSGGGEWGTALPVRVLGGKVYYLERGGFSVFGILKNPMILMGLVSMLLFVGMPKLVENMDPEMRAEWEENQKNNPMNSLMGGGQPGSNFDVAAFLAGSNKKDEGGSEGSGTGSKKAGKR